MRRLKYTIPELFDETEMDRVDYYVDKIRDSYSSTNRLFVSLTVLQILSIFSFYLFFYNKTDKIYALGFEVKDAEFIKIWFLVLPSTLFLINSYIGYLRVYQKEAIEWILAKYRSKEYKSEIFRLTFPSNYILGSELVQLQDSKWIKILNYLPTYLIAIVSTLLPIFLAVFGYLNQLDILGSLLSFKISLTISLFCYAFGILMIRWSQKI